ncbi:LAETG motif-containing sortase-dependent surface protein [Streptomyces sp. NBC_01497]|uniref:LAETG motif-containing sortase-dependent surface protein n=1 Tax=Streptomyces sp. NBC_01497 TaxID=2903885 RepID=UPI002E339A8E|nr:LAETG motif-containing sortase-dependent surface protein [Streptomyces sp. NBC_01497]
MTRFGSLRRPGALISVAAAGVLSVGLSAGSASAHTPHLTVDCSTATVDLSAYNGNATNHVKVTVQGDDSLTVDQDFKSTFHQDFKLPTQSSQSVHLVVTAGDGSQYNDDETKTATGCPVPSTPPSSPPATTPASTPPSTPASSTPASSTPATPAPSSSTSSAAAAPVSSPSPSGSDLAETGSSSSTPVIAGAAAVVVVAGAGILWASRRRRAAQH